MLREIALQKNHPRLLHRMTREAELQALPADQNRGAECDTPRHTRSIWLEPCSYASKGWEFQERRVSIKHSKGLFITAAVTTWPNIALIEAGDECSQMIDMVRRP